MRLKSITHLFLLRDKNNDETTKEENGQRIYEQIIRRLEIANQNENMQQCHFTGNLRNANEKNNRAIAGLTKIKTVLIGGLFGKQFGKSVS